MILVDAGPLFAILHRRDASHSRCVAALEMLNGPLVTTWPAFTEAMYLLGASAGWHGQEPLWRLVARRTLEIAGTTDEMLAAMPRLMAQNSELPMDLADASLVACAEHLGQRRIFSLDHHFRVYRLPNGHHFDVVP